MISLICQLFQLLYLVLLRWCHVQVQDHDDDVGDETGDTATKANDEDAGHTDVPLIFGQNENTATVVE